MEARRLIPLGSKILLMRDDFSYRGRIIIPETSKSRPTVGEIIAVGPEVTNGLEVGDKVMFAHLSGQLIQTKDETHPRANPDTKMVEWLLLDQSEIWARIENHQVGDPLVSRFLYGGD